MSSSTSATSPRPATPSAPCCACHRSGARTPHTRRVDLINQRLGTPPLAAVPGTADLREHCADFTIGSTATA
jgi:hypothetical protein